MPVLDVRRTYEDDTFFVEADLDNIIDSLETFFNVTKLDSDNIQDAGITASSKFVANSITSDRFLNEQVTTAKLANDTVTGANFVAKTLQTAKFADTSVAGAKIADGALTQAKFADGAIDGAQVTADTIPAEKFATNIQKSTTFSQTVSTASETAVTASRVTITTTGRPVLVYLEGTSSASYIQLRSVASVDADGTIKLYRELSGVPTEISSVGMEAGVAGSNGNEINIPPGCFKYLEQPSANTYTYYVSIKGYNTTDDVSIINSKLVVMEL